MVDLVKARIIEKPGFAATVVSVLPFPLHEKKPQLYPGDFYVAAVNDPAMELHVLGIGESIYYVPLGLERNSYPIRESAIGVASSIVNDYCNSVICVSANAHPGLFAINESLTEQEVELKYADVLKEIRENQMRWFENLVRMAKDDWQRYRQHRVITDIQRTAAKILHVDDEWAKDWKAASFVCQSCRATVDPAAVVCPNCKFILRPEEYAEIEKRFVKSK